MRKERNESEQEVGAMVVASWRLLWGVTPAGEDRTHLTELTRERTPCDVWERALLKLVLTALYKKCRSTNAQNWRADGGRHKPSEISVSLPNDFSSFFFAPIHRADWIEHV